MKALDLPQVILKAAVIIPEGMARHTKAAGRIDLVHEILGRDPFVREAVDAECSNISPERKIFHSHKDRKTGLPGILLRRSLAVATISSSVILLSLEHVDSCKCISTSICISPSFEP